MVRRARQAAGLLLYKKVTLGLEANHTLQAVPSIHGLILTQLTPYIKDTCLSSSL